MFVHRSLHQKKMKSVRKFFAFLVPSALVVYLWRLRGVRKFQARGKSEEVREQTECKETFVSKYHKNEKVLDDNNVEVTILFVNCDDPREVRYMVQNDRRMYLVPESELSPLTEDQ